MIPVKFNGNRPEYVAKMHRNSAVRGLFSKDFRRSPDLPLARSKFDPLRIDTEEAPMFQKCMHTQPQVGLRPSKVAIALIALFACGIARAGDLAPRPGPTISRP